MAESGLKIMNKDLRNVIITFGLIALVFTGSSFVYTKNQEKEYLKEYLLALHQADLERITEEKLELIEQNRDLVESLKKYQSELEIVKKNLAIQLANKNVQSSKVVAQIPVTPIPKPATTPTPVVTQVKTPTPVKKTVVVKPSRKSRAS